MIMMGISFSLLNKNRSIVGFEIVRSGNVEKGEGGSIVIKSTVEITFGFIFAFITLSFETGSSITLNKFKDSFDKKVEDYINENK